MIVSMWAETNEGTTPTAEELMELANQYGITAPVVADPNWTVSNRYEQDGGIPTQNLIGPGMEIILVDEWVSDSDIEAALP